MNKKVIIFVMVVSLVNCDHKISETLLRSKRLTTFPYNSCAGITVAIALPLNLPNRNVFYAVNFEANYNEPYPYNMSNYIIPGPLAGPIMIVTTESSERRELKKDDRSSFLSRKKVYSIFEKKITSLGLKGRACLLRMICEGSHIPVNLYNGVLGDIIHVILSPSTSIKEKLHPEFYLAEKLGAAGNCSKYQEKCGFNFLDLASSIVHNVF